MKKALLFGASGFIGSYLLELLLADNDYEQIIIIVRKNIGISHPKLKVLIGDFHTLPQLKAELVADDIFIALGTTKKQSPDPKIYYQIDHDYPVLAAALAKANGAKSVFLVSSVGADANSPIFYTKIKGETERDIIALDFEHTHVFEPSMLLGNRQQHRPMEKIWIQLFAVINPLLAGGLHKYKGIDGRDVAKAMLNATKKQSEKVKIYEWREMTDLLSI